MFFRTASERHTDCSTLSQAWELIHCILCYKSDTKGKVEALSQVFKLVECTTVRGRTHVRAQETPGNVPADCKMQRDWRGLCWGIAVILRCTGSQGR
jgi:hypothetical protein